jgi:hypothetical protein
MLKARMTIMPERFSRITRLSRSIRLCMILNFGKAIENTTRIKPIRTMTARAIIHHIEALLASAMMMPPTPMIGA